MKKLFSFWVVFVFMGGMLAGLPITAVEEYTSGVLTYTVDGSNATIKKCNNYFATNSEVAKAFSDIQSKGHIITEIGNNAFLGCEGLTAVTIPDSVISIGHSAFDMSSLAEITIPDSVLSIGSSAFFSCQDLTEVIIPNSVLSIGENAFEHCYNLEKVIIPDSVTSIGSFAFHYCTNLTEITIPNSITVINSSTFLNCNSLKRITIPKSVLNIGDHAIGYSSEYEDGEVKYTKIPNFVICGYVGSAAEYYAKANDILFSIITDQETNSNSIATDKETTSNSIFFLIIITVLITLAVATIILIVVIKTKKKKEL